MLGITVTSPEVWKDQPYDMKSDIWSLGCVLYESVCLHPPFRSDDMQGLYKKVLRGVYPKIPEPFSVDLASILHLLLQVSPMSRPTCIQILQTQIVQRRISLLFPDKTNLEHSSNILLQTIKIPRDLLYLTDKLPKPSYENDNKRNTSDMSEYTLPKLHSHSIKKSSIIIQNKKARSRKHDVKHNANLSNIDIATPFKEKSAHKIESEQKRPNNLNKLKPRKDFSIDGRRKQLMRLIDDTNEEETKNICKGIETRSPQIKKYTVT